MSGEDQAHPQQDTRILNNPWPFLVSALFILALTLPFAFRLGSGTVPAVAIGLLLASVGVVIRPGSWRVLASAALCGATAFLCMLALPLGVSGSFEVLGDFLAGHPQRLPTAWDSARLMIGALTLVAAISTVLMLLPRVPRRVVVSLFIVIHFGGIVSATMSVPPSPWLAQLVWTYFYRPYLELAYLVNAYHFYSPEPGPATQLWFYVKYDDGSNEWFKTPRPGEPPLKLEYFRRLSLAEYANQRMPAAPVPREKFEERILAGRKDGVSEHMTLPDIVQYQEPSLSSKIVLESYARRMFHHPPTPTKAVAGVRIYRATHALMTPKEFAMGRDPEDPNQFGIYYMGEYDADGKIKDPEDPYLYWLIPSVRYNIKPGYKGPVGIGPDGPIGMERDPAEFPFLEKHVTLPARRH